MEEQTYVIWLEFEEAFTNYLNAKCSELEENHISEVIRPPHLTLAFVKTDQHERLIEYVKNYFLKSKVEVLINSIGQFSGGNIFYAPKANNELLSLHNDFCQGLCEIGEQTWDLYYPGNWTPHIALTGELCHEDSVKAFSIMRKGFTNQMVLANKVLIWAYKGSGEKTYLSI